MILGPITKWEAEGVLHETTVNTYARSSSVGKELPEGTKKNIRRCLHAPLRILIERDIIRNGRELLGIFAQLKPLVNVPPAEAGSRKKETEVFRTVPYETWPSEWLGDLFSAAIELLDDPNSKLDTNNPELQRTKSLVNHSAVESSTTIG